LEKVEKLHVYFEKFFKAIENKPIKPDAIAPQATQSAPPPVQE
jgi:hypothetical protein